jgi:hypothetical protein
MVLRYASHRERSVALEGVEIKALSILKGIESVRRARRRPPQGGKQPEPRR